MTEKVITEGKRFDLVISQLSSNTRGIYNQLLLEKQIGLAKENGGKPVTLSIEDREEVLDQARRKAQYGNADSERMAKDWDSRDKRPPIGGSQDD